MKNRTVWSVAFALLVSSIALAPTSQARNTPTAPNKSFSSLINFSQDATIYAWDSVSSYPTFDFSSEDIEVEVSQNVNGATINTINIDLPSGFVVTGFDATGTYFATDGTLFVILAG
jgi:hypothetical protein